MWRLDTLLMKVSRVGGLNCFSRKAVPVPYSSWEETAWSFCVLSCNSTTYSTVYGHVSLATVIGAAVLGCAPLPAY